MEKQCRICEETKPLSAFGVRSDSKKPMSLCRTCDNKRTRAKRKRFTKIEAIAYLGGECKNSCCPLKALEPLDEVLYDFHHRDPEDKKFCISKALRRKVVTRTTFLKELDKCDLLCCVCHRLTHKSSPC